jgi:tRNA A37 threonylcarbamoyladenosine synthetase subunit TsaC/SUA5/YrdC
MKTIDLHHPDTFALAIEAIHQHPIIVQLPTVFVLLAAPTSKGAAQLNETKKRLPRKNYGTAIGSLPKFIAQALPGSLPAAFSSPDDFVKMTGTFIRLQFRDKNFQSTTIANGTHQGLLLEGVYADLFKAIEHSFETYTPDKVWAYKNYAAPLCTSCNISGDPEGSITALDKALHFAREKNISFFIQGEQSTHELGSYPIFGYERHKVSIHRAGPKLEVFKEKIPYLLRAWEAVVT